MNDQVAIAVGQLQEPANSVVGVIHGEAGLIDALRALADDVVGELEESPIWVLDLGEQVGVTGVAVAKVICAVRVGGARQVPVGIVGVGIGGAVREVSWVTSPSALYVEPIASPLASRYGRLAERVVANCCSVPLA